MRLLQQLMVTAFDCQIVLEAAWLLRGRKAAGILTEWAATIGAAELLLLKMGRGDGVAVVVANGVAADGAADLTLAVIVHGAAVAELELEMFVGLGRGRSVVHEFPGLFAGAGTERGRTVKVKGVVPT